MKDIVVIGAGQAGASLCAKLRQGGYDGKLSLFGKEVFPPYQRPPLSKKYLLGEIDVERLYIRPKKFYSEHDIHLSLDSPISHVPVPSLGLSQQFSWKCGVKTEASDIS